MIGVTDKISAVIGLVSGAVVTFGLCASVYTLVLQPADKRQGRSEYIAEKAVEDLKAERDRRKDDATLQGLSDHDLCVRALGRVPECDVFVQPVRQE